MRHFVLTISCVLFACVALSSAAHAERMKELSVRNIYGKLADDIKDKSATMVNLNFRLADQYKLIADVTHIKDGAAPVTEHVVKDKKQILTETEQSYPLQTIFKYKFDITVIQFSQDNQTAYVSYTSTKSGLTIVKAKDGSISSKPFEVAMGCVDTVNIHDITLNIAQSECQIRDTLGQ